MVQLVGCRFKTLGILFAQIARKEQNDISKEIVRLAVKGNGINPIAVIRSAIFRDSDKFFPQG
jgi:hypothetical protein